MKSLAIYLITIILAFSAKGQYYLRGEVRDEKNLPISNVKIFVHSSRSLVYTGPYGSFGFNVNPIYDSLTLSADGFETKSVRVKSEAWQQLVLKANVLQASKSKPKLLSVTGDFTPHGRPRWFAGNETYFQLVENEEVDPLKYPITSFSLNVNKASYSNIRRFLNMQSSVPPDAVRIEEMINYFNLHYRKPEADNTFDIETAISPCPWNPSHGLLYINTSARKVPLENIPPGNFVFLVDVSGSMDMPDKLPILKAAFQLFVKNLRPIDTMSIVMYGGSVGIWLPPTPGDQKEKISKAIEELTPGGDTPGESALLAAYKLAESSFIKGGNNRVILATDGDFNVGKSSEQALDELITRQRQTGIYLTCLGVGKGNYKDSKLQTLARKGNGNFAYFDNVAEAEKVLVKELTQTLYAVADDVLMKVEFNAAQVKSYRLIGFDNKKEVMSDTDSEMEGSEIGTGSNTLAIFEIEPGNMTQFTTPDGSQNFIARISLNYSLCNDTSRKILRKLVFNNYLTINKLDKDYHFAAAVAFFGLMLKQSKYLPKTEWKDVYNFAKVAADKDIYLQTELLGLIAKSEKLYKKNKKRFKKKS
ncbi:MAG: von Willebrand factor type A domain-containing protein [Ferruginibacter sp.]